MDVVKSTNKFFTNAYNTLYDRLSTPVSFIFVLSWLIFNWPAIYFLFASNADAATKIAEIQTVYTSYETTLFNPALLTLVVLVFYPAIKNLSGTIWTWSDNWSNAVSEWFVKKNIRLTREEQEEHFEIIESQLKDKRKQLEVLTQENNELKSLTRKIGTLSAAESPKAGSDIIAAINSNPPITATIVDEDGGIELTPTLMTNFIKSVDGEYRLKKHLAPKMLLDIDDPVQKKELDVFMTILSMAINEFPSPVQAKELTIGNTRYPKSTVLSYMKKLAMANIVDINKKNGVQQCSLTKETKSFLKTVIEDRQT